MLKVGKLKASEVGDFTLETSEVFYVAPWFRYAACRLLLNRLTRLFVFRLFDCGKNSLRSEGWLVSRPREYTSLSGHRAQARG